MSIPLEDNFADIIGKAQRGLKISDSELAAGAGMSREAIQQLRDGTFSESTARAVAQGLRLNADALVVSGRNSWHPGSIEMSGVAMFTTPFQDITVNSYLVWDPASLDAAAFDTGADCTGMLNLLDQKKLKLKLILLTHTHGDHIFDLDRLQAKTGAPAFVNEREPIDGASTFDTGSTFETGRLRIETRLTWGHSRGGTTYVVHGLERLVAVVGDAMFAGSMGGGMVSYADALRTNRAEILTLPDDTIICPGHGPMTTVAEEKVHNPFFA